MNKNLDILGSKEDMSSFCIQYAYGNLNIFKNVILCKNNLRID